MSGGTHFDRACGVTVDPAAAFGCHLEGGGDAEEPPLAGELRKDAQALGAIEAEVAANGGQETVDADMSLGHHRVEDTIHPRRRSEGALIRSQMTPGAQQLAVRAQHTKLLVPQHHVVFGAMKERQKPAPLISLLMAPGRWEEAAELVRVENGRLQWCRR